MQIQPVISSYNTNIYQNRTRVNTSFGALLHEPLISTYHANIERIQSRLNCVFYLCNQSRKPAPEIIDRGVILLNLVKNMSLIDYICLTKEQKQILKQITPREIRRDAFLHYDLATTLRKYINNNFGSIHNCTLLPVGRSLATVCETLKYMGHDVKFLPMSGMMQEPLVFSPEQIKAYKDYLSSVGLTENIIRSNPKHNYILLDFTTSGRSLKKCV